MLLIVKFFGGFFRIEPMIKKMYLLYIYQASTRVCIQANLTLTYCRRLH